MLKLVVSGEEQFDAKTSRFITGESFELELEHSLISLSKWESIHKKPFLGKTEKTLEETLSYIECMILSPNYPEDLFENFTTDTFRQIHDYIESTESATTFGEMPEQRGRGETITSELIYYWMVAFQIPFETETWHLNRLFALIKICNIKNQPPDKRRKMSKGEIVRRNRELNEQRRAQYGTRG